MSDEMEEIINDFLVEAEESLDKIDPLFVELEEKGHDQAILDDIFRSMHTLKGAAGFLGFQQIVDIAHSAESIMKKLREGEIAISKQMIDVILKTVDMLRRQLQHIKAKDGIIEDNAPLLKELDKAMIDAQTLAAGGVPAGVSEAMAEPEPAGVPEPVQPVFSSQAPQKAAAAPVMPEPPVVIAQQASEAEKARPEKDKVIAEDKKEALQTLRVDIDRIDKVMNLTGEVVMVRNRLLNIKNYLEQKYADDKYVESLFETVSFLDLVTSDMQLAVMKMRMQPIKKVFGKFPRLVRDITKSIGKDVDLKISGEETEVDKSVIEQIGDPMVHIIRNAVDHGLESVEERRLKCKPERGTISISAYQQGTQIIIEVSDDGKGINVERVKKKALEKSLITEEEAQRMTDDAAINLIFLPGFSTHDVATELSGRGVGMDVVKTNISKLNGYVEVLTKKDLGSTFRISIPLTLAIIQALMVRTGSAQYAIPLAPIVEIIKITKKDLDNLVGQKALVIRGKVHPFFELSDILGGSAPVNSDSRYVVVISIGDKRFCLGVDEMLGQEEVVIKTIEGVETDASHILGATITGEGKVVLILDLSSISKSVLGLVTV